MAHVFHYGRRVAIPATVQIRHELRIAADDEIRARCAAEDGLSGAASWDDIAAHRAGPRTR